MDKAFFQGNRAALIDALDGGLVVLSAFTKMQGAGDSAAAFCQEANFWWLTGIDFPDWQLIIDGASATSWLVAPEINGAQQLFDGSLSPEEAKRISGVDSVLSLKETDELFRRLSSQSRTVYTLGEPHYAENSEFAMNPAPGKLRELLQSRFSTVNDCRRDLARLRAIKQPSEIEMMKRAAEVTMRGFTLLKEKLSDISYEYEAEAELTYSFRRQGAYHAFEPIAASGSNACTLHYISNAAGVERGKLLLIDAGARVTHYSGDVTRTYAVGQPTQRQVDVHEAVRTAMERIIALVKPGLGLREYIDASNEIMQDALLSLGLIKHNNDRVGLYRYFPHAVSHGLGIDVHESLGGFEQLMPGMVLTVEPGIYIPKEGIGVRIEDDIYVTDERAVNLTAGLSTDI